MPDDPDWQDCRDTHPHAADLPWWQYVLLLGGAIGTGVGLILLLAWAGSWIGGM